MKHIFVVNPAAGNGLAEKTYLPLIHAAVKENGAEYEIHRSLNKQEIGEYVRQRAAEGGQVRFYACGGDGTINDVLCGMFGFVNAELAVMPGGTGNDFAKNFTGAKALKDVRALMAAGTEPCDVIRYDGGYSINMINIGVDCDVAAEASRLKGPLIKGPMAYIAAAARVLPHPNYYRLSYEFEGAVREEELMLCAVANGRFCGGGFKSAPEASVNDGLMDVGIVRPVKGARMLSLLLKYHNGTHLGAKEAEGVVEYFKCSSFSLYPSCDVDICVDGEVTRFSGSTFTVLPQAVRVAVPEGCSLI